MRPRNDKKRITTKETNVSGIQNVLWSIANRSQQNKVGRWIGEWDKDKCEKDQSMYRRGKPFEGLWKKGKKKTQTDTCNIATYVVERSR